MATDGAEDSTAWWVDDVQVTNISDSDCGGSPLPPPGEVSPLGSTYRLLMAMPPAGGPIQITFMARPGSEQIEGYNIYQGELDRPFFDHGATPFMCDAAFTTLAPEHLSSSFAWDGNDNYYYVTAWNGDAVNGEEGTTGAGRPPAENSCLPVNDN